MSRTSLGDIDIHLDRIYTVFDHDGNVHPGDIGKDYFYDSIGFEDVSAFVDEVGKIRGNEIEKRKASELYSGDEGHSDAEELAIFIANYREDHSFSEVDVEKLAEEAIRDGYDREFRDGVPTFINDLAATGSHPIILSAGDETFLREFYDRSVLFDTENGVDEESTSDLHVIGSRQNWDHGGIDKGCGNAKKPVRYEQTIQAFNGAEKPMLYSGDSSSDRRPLLRADLGLATGSGAMEYADVVVKEDQYFERKDSWYGQAAVAVIYAGLIDGHDEQTIVEETAAYVSDLAEDDEELSHIEVRSPAGGNDHLQYLNEDHAEIRPGEKIAGLWSEVQRAL